MIAADTDVLQNASNFVSTSALYGQWAFIPVTDGKFIKERPTTQLLKGGKLNGVRILSTHNRNEAPDFTPQGLTTEENFVGFVSENYPMLSEENITSILDLYYIPANASNILVASNGENPPYSTTNSEWAYGWQQAATNLYAETTFICPSYWLADGYANKEHGKAWTYQFSVPPAQHGYNMYPLFAPTDGAGTGMDTVFRTALQYMFGNFVLRGDPTLDQAQISALDGNGGNITAAGAGVWPQWQATAGSNWMLNLNMTGGIPVNNTYVQDGVTLEVVSYMPSNNISSTALEADFQLVEGYSWEGGRGKRCQLWADLAPWTLE